VTARPVAARTATCEDVFEICSDWEGQGFTSQAACIEKVSDKYDLTCTGDTKPESACGDGRVNENCGAPVITYCDSKAIEFWMLVDGKGEKVFSVAQSDLPESVSEKTLVKKEGDIKLYMQPDGTFLLLAPQSDGKIYYMILDADTCATLREGAEWNLE
jgi:hypothetical protein